MADTPLCLIYVAGGFVLSFLFLYLPYPPSLLAEFCTQGKCIIPLSPSAWQPVLCILKPNKQFKHQNGVNSKSEKCSVFHYVPCRNPGSSGVEIGAHIGGHQNT